MRVAVAWRDTACACVEVWQACDVSCRGEDGDHDDADECMNTKNACFRDVDLHRLLRRAGGGLRRLSLRNASELTPTSLMPLHQGTNRNLLHLDVRGCFASSAPTLPRLLAAYNDTDIVIPLQSYIGLY